MKKLKDKLHLESAEVLVVIIFFLFSLRIINWFEHPYVLISGDLRPPLVQEAFTDRVTYTWNEIDLGFPSIYAPRILDPFYFFITVFQTLGLSLYGSQIITVFLIYFLSLILMYILVKQLTNGNITASFVAALYLTSNVYLVNDREVTAIGFVDIALMILPCLITFAKGTKTHSYRLTAASGILCVLTYATFPNYRTTLICLITLGLISIFLFMNKGIRASFYNKKESSKMLGISINTTLVYHHLKLLVVFAIAFLLASIWAITLIYLNFATLNTAYTEMSTPWFVGGHAISDATRLIAKWSFYSGTRVSSLWRPYLPYGDVYLNNPLAIILCYLPAILAFTSLTLSKEHKITIFFGSTAVVALFLTSGFSFSEYGNRLYIVLMRLPPLVAFREPSNWVFFAVFSFSILIGLTVSALCHKFRNKGLRIFTLSSVAILFLSTTYPLVTGDVARNWIDPNIKGSYFPSSYIELNTMLSSRYWAIMLPQRGVYVIYNFTEGPLGCGNPYPLIFSKPIISGVGTEYIQPENLELIDKLHEVIHTRTKDISKFLGMLGIRYLVLEKNIILGNTYPLKELNLNESKSLILAIEWSEIALFNNTNAVEKIYIADNILNYATLNEMYNITENAEWSILNHSAFVDLTSMNKTINKTLAVPEKFVWKEVNPTRYEANVESKGAFILVFLEAYNEHWKLYVNGKEVSEINHLMVNAYANGWLVDDTGKFSLIIHYETQSLLTTSVAASLILPAILLAFLSRRDLRAIIRLIARELKRRISNSWC